MNSEELTALYNNMLLLGDVKTPNVLELDDCVLVYDKALGWGLRRFADGILKKERLIDFGDGISFIENPRLFRGNKVVTHIHAPGLKYIPDGAFADCSNLMVVYADNVTLVGNNAFKDCKKLSQVGFSSLEHVGSEAFAGCISLSSVEFPNLSFLEDKAFINCVGLKYIKFPKLKQVGDYAFMSCQKLFSCECPNVQTVGFGAFTHCDSLCRMELPNLTTASKAFVKCKSLQTVRMPSLILNRLDVISECSNLQTLEVYSVKNSTDIKKRFPRLSSITVRGKRFKLK